MPAQTAAVVNPANIIYSKAYLYLTIAGGPSDDKPFAELQDVQIKSTFSLKELMGPEQLSAVAVGIAGHKITLTAKWGKIRAGQLKALRGGTSAFSTKTTHSIGVASEPVVFNARIKTPLDGTDAEIILLGCICPELTIPLSMNDFVIPDFSAEVFGDGTNLMQIILPGDQTTS